MKKDANILSDWHILDLPAILKLLKTSKSGLSSVEADKRRRVYGYNVLPEEKRESSFKIFLNQIKSPLIYVMLFALAVSIALKEIIDAAVIFFIIFVNVLLGWIEEKKAGDAISKLKKIVVYKAKVLRDGRQALIEVADIVPGDVIVLRSGDKVPADCRIISCNNFQVDEALLTGESIPADKNNRILTIGIPLAERSNMAYMGTAVVRGTALAVAVEIGVKTEMGKIGNLLALTKNELTPLQEQLQKLSALITIVVICLCFFILIVGLAVGYDLPHMLITASSLAVAAIPEGLLIALTVVLALGMQRILQRKSLVRRLVAAETLGGVSIILTDKTGTLTEGKMQVARYLTIDQEFFKRSQDRLETSRLEKEYDLMLKISMLCSSAKIENPEDALTELKIVGDPTEGALLLAGLETGFNKDELDKAYPKLQEIPFDSEQKYMASMHHHKSDNHYHVFVKGAPEKVLAFCNQVYLSGKKQRLTASQRKKISGQVSDLAATGLRVLALAYKTGGKLKDISDEINDLVFIGLIALKDPLRAEAAWAINECRKAGIRPIMITGDHPLTAKAIFEELGFVERGRIITGAELDQLSDSQLDKKMDKLDIYARVEPHHKLRLVQAWRSRGAIVAMTGDGINDAPALKAADIGIALGSGSDVTKETADIILLDNNFKTIVEAISEGRIIFDNIRKITFYLLSGSFSEIILIAGSMIMGLPLPLTALQILWINLIDHGIPSLAMTMEREEDDIMKYPPRPRNEPIINRDIKIMLFLIVLITDVFLLGLFFILNRFGYNVPHAQTLIFAISCMDSLFYAYSIRSLRRPAINRDMFKNKYLTGAVILSLLLIFPTLYPPLGGIIFKTVPLIAAEWLLVFAFSGGKLLAIEIAKYILVIRKNKYAHA